MKIAYFGFDLFYDCIDFLAKEHQIVKIFTCNVDGVYETNDKVYNLARKFDIPITDEKATASDISQLESLGCDLMVSAGYYFKIPISEKIKAINIHPSLLPEGRGPWPLPVIILNDIVNSGITCHRIAESFDTGEILHQIKITVLADENLETLTQKMQTNAVTLLREVIDDFEELWNNKKPQTKGSYWPEPTVKEMSFTVTTSFGIVEKITRAFYGYKAFFYDGATNVEFTKAICLRDKKDAPDSAKAVYDISDGYLCIIE